MNVPLCRPYLGLEEANALLEVLKSGWLAHGPKAKQFEQDFAKYIGVKHAISVNSCTSALHTAIQAYNLHGEIIVPSFTFSASANSIITAGCKPVFADVLYDTCNIDPSDIKQKITNKTVGIMPVHYGGQACQMDEIRELAEKYNLVIIEDSAEAIGAEYKGKKTGAFGIGCFSFWATKNITTGEGGMVTTNDDEVAERVKAIKAHGNPTNAFEREKQERPWYRAATFAGYNFRLPDVLAALGVEQLKKLDWMNEQRRKHSKYLNDNLKNIKWIDLPVEHKDCKHVYQMYTIKVKNKDRNEIAKKLIAAGIGASVHFDPPVHKQPYYLTSNVKLPITEKLAECIVTLPMFPHLTREELDYIVETIKNS